MGDIAAPFKVRSRPACRWNFGLCSGSTTSAAGPGYLAARCGYVLSPGIRSYMKFYAIESDHSVHESQFAAGASSFICRKKDLDAIYG
eukprot:232558-Hanusia_phi.AAC.1